MIGNDRAARMAGLGDLLEIGRGNYRTVYYHDNVVYKVENHEGIGQNQHEFNRAASHRNILPAPFRLPEMSLYPVNDTFVLAAECIKGQEVGICALCIEFPDWVCDDPDVCVYDVTPKGFEEIWTDSCVGNAIRNESGIYIVDFVW